MAQSHKTTVIERPSVSEWLNECLASHVRPMTICLPAHYHINNLTHNQHLKQHYLHLHTVPCGTTPIRCAWQYVMMALTSCVDRGSATTVPPRYTLVQSIVYLLRSPSSASVKMTFELLLLLLVLLLLLNSFRSPATWSLARFRGFVCVVDQDDDDDDDVLSNCKHCVPPIRPFNTPPSVPTIR
jgi:hypothetical protein